MTTEPLQALQENADSFQEAMFVTHGADGTLRARPMGVAGRDGRILWLVTSDSSPKAAEVDHDPRVLVAMQGKGRFVTLAGTARLVRDEDKAAELWSPAWRAWFSSPQDPELVLVRIELDEGAYWDRRGRAGLKTLLQMAKNIVMKDDARPEADPEQHARVSLD